jgi:nitronate monooxygenase
MLDLDQINAELKAIKESCDKPFNVNFFCHQSPVADAVRERGWRTALEPYYKEFGIDPLEISAGVRRDPFNAEMLEILRAFKPAVVSFHFGLPADNLLAGVKAMGSKIFCSATTVAEALWLEARGVDAIIAQGVEAGGHRGMFLDEDITSQVGIFALLPQILQAVKLPVIAAGGMGACAAQIGTAYLLCDEATTSEVHRSALKAPTASHTALTNRFSGRPARSIVNRVMRELGPIGEVSPFPLAATAIAPLRRAAEARGLGDFSPLWSGQNPSGCREIPAAELTRCLAELLPIA